MRKKFSYTSDTLKKIPIFQSTGNIQTDDSINENLFVYNSGSCRIDIYILKLFISLVFYVTNNNDID